MSDQYPATLRVRITKAANDKFLKTAKKNDTDKSSVIRDFVDQYNTGETAPAAAATPAAAPKAKAAFKISKADRAVIETAASASGKSFDQFISDAALKAAAKGTRPGGAIETITKAVEKIMHHNAQPKVKWYDRVEITQGVLGKKEDESDWGCGSNLKTIRNYLAVNQDRIDAHHKKVGIEAEHNRRASLERRKIARKAEAAAKAKKAKK